MKFSLSTAEILLALAVAFNSHMVNAGCNADNCLRALFPSASPSALSVASAFCATYTTTINTQTTGFPTRATGACGTAPARYSSACSCKPTATSTLTTSTTSTTPSCAPTPANNVVKNGGFECGLAPWVATDITNTQHTITSPGDNSNYAYEFLQKGEVVSVRDVANVTQDLAVTVGQDYTLTFRAYFQQCTGTEGFVGVMLNHEPVWTYDACDGGPPYGVYKTQTIPFTAAANPENLRFDFVVGPATDVIVKIDNVVVVPT